MKKREEAEIRRREMEEGLRVFREARKGEKKEDEGEEVDVVVEGGWKVGGKRKRRKGETEVPGLLKGVKRRASSTGGGGDVEDEKKDRQKEELPQGEAVSATSKRKEETGSEPAVKAPARAPAAAEEPKPKPKLGLVAYGSDDDDDDDDDDDE